MSASSHRQGHSPWQTASDQSNTTQPKNSILCRLIGHYRKKDIRRGAAEEVEGFWKSRSKKGKREREATGKV
jgi:hypothetical protein